MSRPRKHRALRIVLYALGGTLLLVVAVILGAIALLNVPAVKAQVEHRLSEAMNGKLTWDALHIRLLPSPRAVLEGVKVDRSGHFDATVENAQAQLRLLPLFIGRAEIIAISITRPALRIDLAPSSSEKKGTPATDPVAAYRSVMERVVEGLRKFAPDTRLEIVDASVEIVAPNIPPVQLRNVSVRVQTQTGGAELEGSLTSNFSGDLKVAARVEYADLSGTFSLDVADVKPQPWLDRALANSKFAIGIGAAELHARARTDAKTALECDFQLGIASMQIARAERRLQISEVSLEGNAAVHEHELEFALGPLRFGSLVPAARATLRITRDANNHELTLEVPRVDLGALREAAITLVGDHEVVRTYAPRIRGGEISDLRLKAESETWKTLFALDHLAASGTLANAVVVVPIVEREATGLGGHVELADATVALTAAVAQLERSRLTDGTAQYSFRDKNASASAGFELDCAPALDIARVIVPQAHRKGLDHLQSANGTLKGNATLALDHRDWKVSVDAWRSDATVRLDKLPWPVTVYAGRALISHGRVSFSRTSGAVGASSFDDASARLTLGHPVHIDAASGHAILSLGEIYPWLKSQEKLAHALRDIPSVTGNAQLSLHALSGPTKPISAMAFEANLRPEHVVVEISKFPGPVTIDAGALSVDTNTVKIDRAAVQMLDARGLLSGTIQDYRIKRLQIAGAVSDGVIGENSMHWIWQQTRAPMQLQPKTPLPFAIERLTWGPDRALDAQALVQFDAGPKVSVAAAWQPGVLDIRRLDLKDAISDATLSLQSKDRLVHARFSGSLLEHSLDAMFNLPHEHVGRVAGDLRLILDLERRGRTTAEGSLRAEALDFSDLLHQPLKLDRLDVTSDGTVMRIKEVVLNWAQQVATIKGDVKRGERTPIVTAELDSPGIVIDALLPAGKETVKETPPDSAHKPGDAHSERKPPHAQGAPLFPKLWPLPVAGQLKVRAGFIEYKERRVEPVTATLTLAEQQIRFALDHAQLCGIAFPLSVEIEPQHAAASVHIDARKQQLENTLHCLSQRQVLITGDFDAGADLKTQGGFDELLKNLQGTVRFEARKGKVIKFALLGSILKAKDVSALFKHGGAQLEKDGFSYRRLAANGHFEDGQFIVEEAAFDAGTFGLAATGWISVLDGNTQLNVLVAPFGLIDRLARAIPIFGYIFGGTLTSVPIGVTGDIRHPKVVPLEAAAVGSELSGIFTRTFKLPSNPKAPSSSSQESKLSRPEE